LVGFRSNYHCYIVKVRSLKACVAARHRDKTRVQMAAEMFPHFNLLCGLFMGPTFGFDTKQRNIYFPHQIWCFFTIKTRF
jgi:hypothetical protein